MPQAPTVFIKDFKNHISKSVQIRGWLFNKRGSGKILFLQLRDGTGITQGIASQGDLPADTWEKAQSLTMESSVIITGKVSQHPKNPEIFELQIKDLDIIQLATDNYPISKKEHGASFLLNNRHLWLRSAKQTSIQRVRNTIINAIYEFLNNEGFIKIDAPILTPSACEGTTELFEVPYFDLGSAYLSQSGQLYLEAAIFGCGRCFDFGPVFRAEKSKTRRHLTEFWMMDAEAAFVEHAENLEIQERLIEFVVASVLEKNKNDLEILERDLEPLKKIKAPFFRMTHSQAVAKLRELGSDIDENDDLGGDDETILTQQFDKPIFIEKYPAQVKAFYMKRDPENENLALCADMLAPEGFGEIIGGSQREDDYDTLLARIKEHKLPLDDFSWYLDLRKFGSVPHSGFGIGLERLTGWLCNRKHIRETIPFPRTISRKTP